MVPFHRVLTIVTLVGAAACAAPKVDITAETTALVARSEGVSAAEAAKDREKALTFWAADAVVQPAGMPQIQGRDAISALYRTFFDSSGMKSFEGKSSGFTVAQSGDVAYETGINRMVFATPSGDVLDVGKYMAVWKKIDGVWYVAALSFTSDAPAPVPIPK